MASRRCSAASLDVSSMLHQSRCGAEKAVHVGCGVLEGEDVIGLGHTGALVVLCGGACCAEGTFGTKLVILKRERSHVKMSCYVFFCGF